MTIGTVCEDGQVFGEAVRERNLLVEHVPITGEWLTVKVAGFVTSWSIVVTAVCPICSAQHTCELRLFIDHLQKHAEDDAAARIKAWREESSK